MPLSALTHVPVDVLSVVLTYLNTRAQCCLAATCTALHTTCARHITVRALHKVGQGTLVAAVHRHGHHLQRITLGGGTQPDATCITSQELQVIATTCVNLKTLVLQGQYSFTLCDSADLLCILKQCRQLQHLTVPFKLMYVSRHQRNLPVHSVGATLHSLRLHGFCSSAFCLQPMLMIRCIQKETLHTLQLHHVDNLNIHALLTYLVNLRILVIKWCRTFQETLLYYYPIWTLQVVKVKHSASVLRTLNPLLQHLMGSRRSLDVADTLPMQHIAGNEDDVPFMRFVRRNTCFDTCRHVRARSGYKIFICAGCIQRRPLCMQHLTALTTLQVYSK